MFHTILRVVAGFLVAVLSASEVAAATAPNRVIVTEKSGVDYVGLGGYPWQIGRPFAPGEIRDDPEVLADGVPVPVQQATVKTRWPDGSAKFAIIQARLPLRSGDDVTVTFQNRARRAAQGLSQASMLAMDFDAEIQLTSGGVTRRASARSMIAAGHYTIWTQGPAATTVILGDHSEARTYDIGFTDRRPFRPLFHATFWPGWGVEVRAIGEVANTAELQDVMADVRVTVGRTVLVDQPSVNMPIKTRWSRRGWIGREPGRINQDYSLAYLAEVKAVPNYDTSLKIPEQRLTDLYTTYQQLNKGLYSQADSHSWHSPMSDPAGRPDIGPFPTWYVVWLYSGDWRMAEYCNFLSEQYGSLVNAHFREGLGGRRFIGDTDARGHVLSINARPSIVLWYPDQGSASDRLTLIAPYKASSGLNYEAEHVPHPYPIHYLLTGEFYALEQLWFAASTELAWAGPPYRGPTGDRAGFYWGSLRSVGWQTVARFEAAYFSPDDSPEAAYFRAKADDTVQALDGFLATPGGSSALANPVFNYWRTTNYDGPSGVWRFWRQGPQGFWGSGGYKDGASVVDYSVTSLATSPWMQGFIVYMLGRAQDLGFDTGRALDYVVRPFIDIVTQSPNPTDVGRYRYPVRRVSDGDYFPTPAEAHKGLTAGAQADRTINTTDFEHSYNLIAFAAASFGASRPNATQAWSWYFSDVRAPAISKGWANNPKWAILPRTDQPLTFPGAPRNLRFE